MPALPRRQPIRRTGGCRTTAVDVSTAEELRDSLLSVSRQLDLSPGEAHPFPEEKTWTFSQHAPFNAVYETNRRSAYLMVQRQRRHPYLALFDGADPNASTPTRQSTTVPTQALYFVNDPFFHVQAATLVSTLLEARERRNAAAGRRTARCSSENHRRSNENACGDFSRTIPAIQWRNGPHCPASYWPATNSSLSSS